MRYVDAGRTRIKGIFLKVNNTDHDDAVLRPDERLGNINWPEMREISSPEIGANDCLLVCAGFEDRSVEVLKRIQDEGRTRFSVGVVRYLPEYPQNRVEELRTISRHVGLSVTEFVYDRENPSGFGEELRDFSQTSSRVFVDISGMSRLLIVQALVALAGNQRHAVSVVYGEADDYPPSKEEIRRDQDEDETRAVLSYLSSGIFEIAAAPELSAVSMLGEAIRLVAFASFNPAQLSNLIQELQPTYVEFIHGLPPRQNNKWRTQAIRELNKGILEEFRGKREQDASTLDYRETLNLLLSIYSERNEFDRIVVAPTGSKMQAVAVGLFRAALNDVQIVYPTPQVFSNPDAYTKGVRQLYQVDLPTEWS